MKTATEFNEEDLKVIQRDWEDLRAAAAARCTGPGQMDIVDKAFEFACSAHNGIRRRSGEPYILHPIAVAKIVVSDIGLGHKSVCAALLHDVVEDTAYTVEDISNLFGEKVASLVDGLTKIKTVLDNEDNRADEDKSLQAENFKRILLTLNDDARVVLIKLADRLHNCRTIEYMPEYKREKILSETMYIFIPLAHRLGLYGIKSEMENIWLRFKEPEAYEKITSLIGEAAEDKEKTIDEFLVPIHEALRREGIEYRIKKRIKSPYSIWNKMRTKNVTFEQISDILAVRIIFKAPEGSDTTAERNECFHIFALITSIYDYRPERVRDWVMHPKQNGYEALHLTALTPERTSVEVQIRSERMDDIAGKGIAAHWNYKKLQPQSEESSMDKWIARVKEILENPDVNAVEMLDLIHNDLVESEISVFDNHGTSIQVTKGSTALDLAYKISPDTFSHAIVAKINYRLSPLSYVLRSGDQVEIITSHKAEPKMEWLQFLKTPGAIALVKEHFGIRDNGPEASGEYIIAPCCNPIPGDRVVGFIRPDGKIEIHKKTCPEADSLASKHGDKIVTPKWVVDRYASFPVRLNMSGIDRMGLMHEISNRLSKENRISFKSINIRTQDGIFEGYMDIWVHDAQTLDSLIVLLEQIEGIQNVTRADIQ